MMPPKGGTLLRAVLNAGIFPGALPPVDLRAVCFVRAISENSCIASLWRIYSLSIRLAANATGKLDIFGHDRHTLRVDRTQVGLSEEMDEVCFRRFLVW